MMWMLALAVAAPDPAAATDKIAVPLPSPQVLLQNCDERKFEATLEAVVDGKARRSKAKICGTEGQSDADWLKTLKDAAAKSAANDKMPAAMREQLLAALRAEIAKVEALIAGVKPLTLPPPRPKPQTLKRQEYSTYTPLPPPPRPAAISASAASVQLPQLSRPRLSFACFTPGDLAGDGPCTGFVRDTLLVVRAGEDVPPGTSLRFVRNGDSRGDVELAQLRKGKFVRIELPREVCQGVVGGRLQIRIVRSAPGRSSALQVVGTEGPYNLTC